MILYLFLATIVLMLYLFSATTKVIPYLVLVTIFLTGGAPRLTSYLFRRNTVVNSVIYNITHDTPRLRDFSSR